MPKLLYDEVSTVTTYIKRNGKGLLTKTQRVHYKNGKGFKEVRYQEAGKGTRRSRKPLTRAEMVCLRKCKFKPFLFRDCNKECLSQ